MWGGKTGKKFENPLFFGFFFNETSERGSPHLELAMNEYLGYICVIILFFFSEQIHSFTPNPLPNSYFYG